MVDNRIKFSDIIKTDPNLALLLSEYETIYEKLKNLEKNYPNDYTDKKYYDEFYKKLITVYYKLKDLKYNVKNLKKLDDTINSANNNNNTDREDVEDLGLIFEDGNEPETTDKEAITEPNKEAITEPNKEAITEPNKEAITEPNKEAITEPNKEAITEPKKEPITEPIAKLGNKPNLEDQERFMSDLANMLNSPKQQTNITKPDEEAEVINIAGETFHIYYDKASQKRRKAIFLDKNDSKKLTENEQRLLTHLLIIDSTYEAVRMYLYDFFEALPNCQTTVALLNNRNCEVSQYVLWSVLLKARQDVQRQLDEASKDALTTEMMHKYQARLEAMKTREIAKPTETKEKEDCCNKTHDEHMDIVNMLKRIDTRLP